MPPAERRLIKEGVVTFAVASLDSARWRIATAVAQEGGYLADERESAFYNERSVTVADVTAQYTDLAARLRTRRALEDRYRALLARARSATSPTAPH